MYNIFGSFILTKKNNDEILEYFKQSNYEFKPDWTNIAKFIGIDYEFAQEKINLVNFESKLLNKPINGKKEFEKISGCNLKTANIFIKEEYFEKDNMKILLIIDRENIINKILCARLTKKILSL